MMDKCHDMVVANGCKCTCKVCEATAVCKDTLGSATCQYMTAHCGAKDVATVKSRSAD